jgi:hypothetical protein
MHQYRQAWLSIEFKTQPRFCPVSLNLYMNNKLQYCISRQMFGGGRTFYISRFMGGEVV